MVFLCIFQILQVLQFREHIPKLLLKVNDFHKKKKSLFF